MKKLFLLLLTCFYSFLTNGQEESHNTTSLSEVSIPSPNAAGLAKYAEIPVGLYTGSANVSVPLGNVSINGYNLPISINYHTSGIRKNDISSVVGLGWTLNAGGVITRTIRGLDDFGGTGYQRIPKELLKMDAGKDNDVVKKYDGAAFGISNGTWDSQPDLFHYNFGSYTGKFVIDHDGNIQSIPKNDIDFKINQDGWTAITPDGTKYTFNEREFSISNTAGEGANSNPYVSGWWLTSVKSTLGEEINIDYEENQLDYSLGYNETKYFKALFNPSGCTVRNEKKETFTSVFGKVISKISTHKNKVYFHYIKDRTDITSAKRLNTIEIYNKNKKVKEVIFNNAFYFSNGKLKLLSLFEKNNNISLPPYEFTYNATSQTNDYSMDHWGFENGKISNRTLIPTFNVPSTFFQGADRSSNKNSLGGLLTHVYYPTGGSTSFKYENHKVNNINIYDYNNLFKSQSFITKSVSLSSSKYEVEKFYINNHTSGEIYYNFKNNKIEGESAGQVSLYKCLDGESCLDKKAIFGLSGSNKSGSKPINNLSKGFYVLEALTDWPRHEEILTNASLSYLSSLSEEEFEIQKKEGFLIGGARISEQNIHDTKGNLQTLKYSYKDANNYETGQIVDIPRYYSTFSFEVNCKKLCTFCNTCRFFTLNSSSYSPLSSSGGSHVVYPEAYIEYVGKGKKVQKFSYYPNTGGNGFPYVPKTDYSWKSGNLTYELLTSSDGKKVQETINQYKYDSRTKNQVRGITLIPRVQKSCGIDIQLIDNLAYNYYETISDWLFLGKQIVRNYSQDGTSFVTTTTENKYDSPDHLNITSQTITNSDGKKYKTTYKYADDLDIEFMETANMVGIPLETKTFTDGTLTGGSKIEYTQRNGNIVPYKSIRLLKDNAGPLAETEITEHTADGYPKVIKPRGFPEINYQWDGHLLGGVSNIML